MNAIEVLECVGYEFRRDGDVVRYEYHGERLDPERARPLIEYVKRHRDEVVQFLSDPDRSPDHGADFDLPAAYPATLRHPAGAHVGVVSGDWRRLETGEIEATYPSYEILALGLVPMFDFDRRELEKRLEKQLRAIRAHAGSDKELDCLQEQYTSLLDKHQVILERLRTIGAEPREFLDG